MLRYMRRLLVPLLLLLILAGGFGWWWYQPERVIARRIVSLFEAVEVEETASEISRSTRGGSLEGFLAPNVMVRGTEETNEYVEGPQSRDGLVANYTMAARAPSGFPSSRPRWTMSSSPVTPRRPRFGLIPWSS